MPILRKGGIKTRPSKSVSSPEIILSSVVLPLPEGPRRAQISLCRKRSATSCRMVRVLPEAARSALRLIEISNSMDRPPARDMPLGRLHKKSFDGQHDGYERQRIGKEPCDIKKLERNPDFKANAIRAAKQFDDEHNLPDKGEARAHRGGEIRGKLRQNDMPYPHPGSQAKNSRHLVEALIEGARAFPQGDGRVGQFIEGRGSDRGSLSQSKPDVGEHNDDKRGRFKSTMMMGSKKRSA